jgi:Bifunctional DNA primase/polymerase, N-terminal
MSIIVSSGRNVKCGVFPEWQPKYAGIAGIATFPIDPEKKYWKGKGQKVGLLASTELAGMDRYQDCNGIGFWCGAKNRITDVDIDSTDEKLWQESFKVHGDTPITVQTASGKFHNWYRHNGEPRSVRKLARQVWGYDVPIDILGSGTSVAPPTTNSKGTYRFIRGGLEDVGRLPIIKGLDCLHTEHIKPEKIRHGIRNTSLWGACMIYAKRAKDRDDVIAYARQYARENIDMSHDFTDKEIVETACKAWRYEERDENWYGEGFVTCTPAIVATLGRDNPDAFVLLMTARSYHWDREQFHLANGMTDTMNWDIKRLRKARRCLEKKGYIVVLHRGGRGAGDPTIYGWRKVR